MKKEFIDPKGRYDSGRAYSPAIKVDVGDSELIFITGQIAKDSSGNIVGEGDIEAQTKHVFGKIVEILEQAGATLDDLVKVNIYLVNIRADFERVSSIRNEFLKHAKPATTTVGIVATVTDGCDIEIEAIAVRGK
jgi:enamine deaminase RidA (YjgF/YER057c/UK114 family)